VGGEAARRGEGLLALALTVGAVSGCLALEPPPTQGEDVYTPPRSATTLKLTGISPKPSSEQGAAPTIWLSFDQYLDPALIGFHDTLSLTSGGVGFTVRAHYELVDKRIVGRLTRPLEHGLAYVLAPKYDNIRSLLGAYMEAAPLIEFTVGAPDPVVDTLEPSTARVPSWEQDISPMLEEGCTCHTLTLRPDDWFDIPPLTYEALVQQPSTQRPDLMRVEPLEPTRSYLMHKLLSDYPTRRGGEMPPRWAEEASRPGIQISYKPLSYDALRVVELWIRAGAPRTSP
jgi:hypothetical protein